MKAALAVLLFALCSQAHAGDRTTSCLTEVVKTPNGVKSYEVQLVADDQKGYHTMRIYKNEGPNRTELPPVAIFYQSEGQLSKLISVETREAVMVYRERVAPTREGAVRIEDGTDLRQLKMTCYL
jgi:hypothetical protein